MMDIQPEFSTLAGTGLLCTCQHGSDLHDLDDATLLGDEENPSFGWRMRCRGVWYPANADPLRVIQLGAWAQCSCTNFRESL